MQRNEQETYAVNVALSLLNKGDKLVYLSHFGSVLYGTNSEKSDCDLKGVFVPSVASLVKGTASHHYRYSSGTDTSKNNAEDVDVELWSIQKWLNMLGAGDTGALDLLFSVYAKHVKPLVNENFLGEFYNNPSCLFDITNSKSYVGYAYGQAKKYGLKGSRMGILKDVLEYLKERTANFDRFNVKAGLFFGDIIEKFGHESYCFMKESKNPNEPKMLFLLGKGFCHSIKLDEMLCRLNNEFDKYGERVKQAAQNENVDWKALSHALRCLLQVEEVLDTSFVQYPLKDAELLKAVKFAQYSWAEVEQMLLEHLRLMEEKLVNARGCSNFRENQEQLLMSFYKNVDFS